MQALRFQAIQISLEYYGGCQFIDRFSPFLTAHISLYENIFRLFRGEALIPLHDGKGKSLFEHSDKLRHPFALYAFFTVEGEGITYDYLLYVKLLGEPPYLGHVLFKVLSFNR